MTFDLAIVLCSCCTPIMTVHRKSRRPEHLEFKEKSDLQTTASASIILWVKFVAMAELFWKFDVWSVRNCSTLRNIGSRMKMKDILPFPAECVILRGFSTPRRYSQIFTFQHLPIQIRRRPFRHCHHLYVYSLARVAAVRSLARILIIQNCLLRQAISFYSDRNETERVSWLVACLGKWTHVGTTCFDQFSSNAFELRAGSFISGLQYELQISHLTRVSIWLLTFNCCHVIPRNGSFLQNK